MGVTRLAVALGSVQILVGTDRVYTVVVMELPFRLINGTLLSHVLRLLIILINEADVGIRRLV